MAINLNQFTIQPVGKRILGKKHTYERKKSNLLLPNQENQNFISIIATGEPFEDDESLYNLSLGDIIVINKYSGIPVNLDNDEFLIIDFKDIIAKIED